MFEKYCEKIDLKVICPKKCNTGNCLSMLEIKKKEMISRQVETSNKDQVKTRIKNTTVLVPLYEAGTIFF